MTSDAVETAAQLLHQRRHRAGTAPVCGECRDDARAIVEAFGAIGIAVPVSVAGDDTQPDVARKLREMAGHLDEALAHHREFDTMDEDIIEETARQLRALAEAGTPAQDASLCCDQINPDTGYRCRRTPIHDAGKVIRVHVQIDKAGNNTTWTTRHGAALGGAADNLAADTEEPTDACGCCELDHATCDGLVDKGMSRCCSDCTHPRTLL